MEIPEGPFKPVDEFEVHLKLCFPEDTPTDLVLSSYTTEAGLYESYPLIVAQFYQSRELAFVHPEEPPLSGRSVAPERLDVWSFSRLTDAVYHAMAQEIETYRQIDRPSGQEHLGKGLLAFLAASKPKYAGLIEWKSPSGPINELVGDDREYWNARAYADGKLKWFFYEYPVEPAK